MFKENANAQRVVGEDFLKVWAWTRTLAEQVEQKAEKQGGKLHRTINFRHIPLIEDEVTF